MTALALALQLFVLGLHVVAPWQLAPLVPGNDAVDRKRLWALTATPLLLAAALAGLYDLGEHPDAALAWGLGWPTASLTALLLALTAVAVALCDLILFAGFRKLEPIGWRFAAGLSLALLLAASVAGELLRTGRGPASGLAVLGLAALCRVPLALAAGEAAWGPVGWLATLAGLTLPLSLAGLAAPVRTALGPDLATLGAATALLLAARFLPLSLRRPAVIAAILLAALYLDRTRDISAALEPGSRIPDILLPEP